VPGQQEVRWSQLKVGVLVIVALSALAALIFLMSGNTGGFWTSKLTLRSYFENSAGLKVGAPVNLQGVTVGNVKEIRIAAGHRLTPVEVIMKINADRAHDIRTDSKTSLETVGVLGDTVVDIDSRLAHGGPAQNGQELKTTETPNLQDVIQASQGTIERLDTILDQVNTLVDSLNSTKGSIGMLINDPTLYKRALSTLNQLSAIVDSVSSGQGSIGKLLKDDTLYTDLKQATHGMNQIVTTINSGQGSIGKLLKDDSLYNNLKESTHNLNDILATINAGKGSLGILTKDPKFAEKLNDTVTRLDSMLTQIDNGQGTVGQLMKNRALYDHLDQVTQQSSSLIEAIRKNPKKYLTIHLKIF
jgi:phospholipid/cholesterol/gamma-HCH transport system substrate-binding protein